MPFEIGVDQNYHSILPKLAIAAVDNAYISTPPLYRP